jgi:hypothetical protein
MKILTLLLTICSFILGPVNAQEIILDNYEAHFENPRELVYVHLNKTKFYEGEMIGFKAYVFDKNSKQLSKNTRNLYCVISDMDNNAIKSSMLLVENGVASSAMDIDSSFVTGRYIFKAYTNWMRNFDEPNHFSAVIEVNDFDRVLDNGPKSAVVEPDVQVLPEGGHLLENVPNSIGIIAKDQFGNGLKDARAYVLNTSNDTITSTALDRFGIGKTLLIPEADRSYRVLVEYGYTFYEAEVAPAEPIGVAMRLFDRGGKTYVSLTTNSKSQSIFEDKPFTAAIHNGGEIILQEFSFSDSQSVNIMLDEKQLFSGMNIITIFDQNNRPILERLYFNYNGIQQVMTGEARLSQKKDSIKVELPLINLANTNFNSLSVSLLPEDTKAYTPKGNIISNLFLKPYIKGHIEDATYYFDKPGAKKAYDLDNLLLTQGWSSYDWNHIFRTPGVTMHQFEQGIDFKVNINNKQAESYLIEQMSKSKSIMFDLPEGEKAFAGKGLYPMDNEKFAMYGITKNGKVIKPGVFATFSPNKIPELEVKPEFNRSMEKGSTVLYDSYGLEPIVEEDVTVLDEVTLRAVRKEQRQDKLRKQYIGMGDVRLVDDWDYQSNITFAQWITKFGFIAQENVALEQQFWITANRRVGFGSPVPLIIFDGVPLRDVNLNILYNFNINNIDYVVIDRNGFSAPFGGSNFGGVIRIKTKAGFSNGVNSVFDGMFVKDFELTFTTNKKFYVPKYIDYNNSFFRDFGVVGWEPNATVTSTGNLELQIPNNYKGALNLYIEGVLGDRKFISEVKTIQQN